MRFALLAAAGLLFATSAVALTPYQPANPSRSPYGYAETQIEHNRVRVTFAGDSTTDRETVETYLLYRAAETTLARGYDHFVVLDHNVEETSEFRSSGPPRPPIAPRNYREVSRYQATSDIVLQRGPHAEGQANAYDARAVMANLSWRIQRPH